MNKKILQLAIPNIITNITIPLLGMVDMIIVGHLSREHIGGITIGTTIFNLLYWNFGFLRMGTSGLTAQSYGRSDFEESTRILVRALTIAISIAILLIGLQIPISRGLLTFIGGSEEIQTLALTYFSIRIWAAPATLSLYALKGWFIGMQNAKTPMWIAIFINILNIIFSFWFVYRLGYDMAGVAWATVIAQYGGLLLAVLLLLRQYRTIILPHWGIRAALRIPALKRFFHINGDIFLRTLCLSIVFTFVTAASTKIGDEVLAVNALLLQFFTLFSYIMDGFAYAGEAVVGCYIGARNRGLLMASIRALFRWGWIISLIFTGAYLYFQQPILSLFTNDRDLIALGGSYWMFTAAMPLCGFAAFLWDGIYVGATASRAMRNAMFVASAAFFFVYYTTQLLMRHSLIPTSPYAQNCYLWCAFLLYLLLRGIMQKVYAPRHIYTQV